MKNNINIYRLFSVVFFTSLSTLAHPQIDRLSVVKSSYHGKSEEVMELFKGLKEGFILLWAKNGPDGLEIAPYTVDTIPEVHWDELSQSMKDFFQCLLDEV